MGTPDLPGAALTPAASGAIPGSVRGRLARIFPGERIALVERVDEMAGRFDALTDQRPATCGAYALSYLLEPLGFARRRLDQFLAARGAAGPGDAGRLGVCR